MGRLLALIGMVSMCLSCAHPISIDQCAEIFEEAADLTRLIADIATDDEEKLAYVEQAAAITDLASSFGCPIVIPMLEDD